MQRQPAFEPWLRLWREVLLRDVGSKIRNTWRMINRSIQMELNSQAGSDLRRGAELGVEKGAIKYADRHWFNPWKWWNVLERKQDTIHSKSWREEV